MVCTHTHKGDGLEGVDLSLVFASCEQGCSLAYDIWIGQRAFESDSGRINLLCQKVRLCFEV